MPKVRLHSMYIPIPASHQMKFASVTKNKAKWSQLTVRIVCETNTLCGQKAELFHYTSETHVWRNYCASKSYLNRKCNFVSVARRHVKFAIFSEVWASILNICHALWWRNMNIHRISYKQFLFISLQVIARERMLQLRVLIFTLRCASNETFYCFRYHSWRDVLMTSCGRYEKG